jgi:hypothetical protein
MRIEKGSVVSFKKKMFIKGFSKIVKISLPECLLKAII